MLPTPMIERVGTLARFVKLLDHMALNLGA